MRTSKTGAIQAVALIVALAAPAAALADAQTEAKEHVKRATALHGDGKYGEALDELTLAYTLDPKPELLYAIGQLHVKLGQCDQATLFYKRFLASKPKKGPAAAAKEAIASCKKVAGKAKDDKAPAEGKPGKDDKEVREPKDGKEPGEVAADPAPAPAETGPAELDPPPPAGPDPGPFAGGARQPSTDTRVERRAWYTDVVGDLLVGGGVVAGVAAGFMYRGARADLDDAEAATTWDRHDELVDSAGTKRMWAVGLGAGAVVLIGAGVARYVWADRTVERREVVVVPDPAGGGLVGVRGRF